LIGLGQNCPKAFAGLGESILFLIFAYRKTSSIVVIRFWHNKTIFDNGNHSGFALRYDISAWCDLRINR
jgi:hypothetical protein